MPPSSVYSPMLFLTLTLFAGCSNVTSPGYMNRHVVSRLSPEQVKQIATERAVRNGFAVRASDPWQVTLFVKEEGLMWTALLYPQPGRGAAWVNIDDLTRKAEFVAPEIHVEQKFAEGSDWLIKIDAALKRIKFPVELEALMREAGFAGAACMGGGSAAGRIFLDYLLRPDQGLPARFEIRCYYTETGAGVQPKIVTEVELAYIDAQTNRYLLIRDWTP